MLIIGLAGKFGSGKDYIGKELILKYFKTYHPHLTVHTFGFGDPLKMHVLSTYSSVQFGEVYPPPHQDKREDVRKILQQEGDLMRRHNPYYWIDRYTDWTKLFERNGCDVLITCDVRFRNEMDYLIHDRRGLVCKVHAPTRTYKPGDTSLSQHVTECDLDEVQNEDYFFVFENDKDCTNVTQALQYFGEFFDRLNKYLKQ